MIATVYLLGEILNECNNLTTVVMYLVTVAISQSLVPYYGSILLHVRDFERHLLAVCIPVILCSCKPTVT